MAYQFVVNKVEGADNKETEIVRCETPESLGEVMRILCSCAPHCPWMFLVRVFPVDTPSS